MATEVSVNKDDPTQRLAVLRTDLEQWLAVFRWAYGLSSALDLAENYRAGRPEKKQSRLTHLTGQCHDRISGYLNDEVSDELLSDE